MPLTRTVLETAPTGLAGVPVSSSQINLSWTLNPRATGYRVYRNGVLIGSTTSNSYSDTGLAAATPYTYTVASYGATGDGPVGTSALVTTQGTAQDTQAPTVPGTPTVTVLSDTALLVNWAASTDNVGVTAYEVERALGALGTFAFIASVSSPSHTSTGLQPQQTYRYRVRARDAAGNFSPYSNIGQGVTQIPAGGISGRTTRSALNVDASQRWATGWPYMDLMKGTSDNWSISGSATVSIDQWLENMAPGASAYTAIKLDADPRFNYVQPGNYIIKGGGNVTKTIQGGSGITNIVASTSRATFTITTPADGVYDGRYDFGIRLTNNTGSTLSRVDGVVVCRVEDEASVDAGGVYTAQRLHNMGNPSCIRTMTLMYSNISPGGSNTGWAKTPAQVALSTERSYNHDRGTPISVCARLAALKNADFWPALHSVTDDLCYNFDATTDRVTAINRNNGTAYAHGYAEGDVVVFYMDTGTSAAGVPCFRALYVRNPSGATFQLSSTLGGAIIDLTQTTGYTIDGAYGRFTKVFTDAEWTAVFEKQADEVKANYNSTGVIHVELLNEPWNSFNFLNFFCLQGLGYARGLAEWVPSGGSSGANWQQALCYGYAHYSLLAYKAFLSRFPRHRVRLKINQQAAWPDLMQRVFDYPDVYGINVDPGKKLQEMDCADWAIASYAGFYGTPTEATTTIGPFMAMQPQNQDDSWWTQRFMYGVDAIDSYFSETRQYLAARNPAIPLTIYETGHHLFIDTIPAHPTTQAFTADEWAAQQRFYSFINGPAGAAVMSALYQKHVQYGLQLFAQFVDITGYGRRFIGGWGLKPNDNYPDNDRYTWYTQLPGKAASIGTEVNAARVMYSGHSLTPQVGDGNRSAAATSLSYSYDWQKQIINGSPIRLRSQGTGSWAGFQDGENKSGSDLNLLTEWTNHATVSGGAYTHLNITERHDLFNCLVYEDTVKYLMAYLEAFTSRTGGQPYLWHCWYGLGTNTWNNPAAIQQLIRYEFAMQKAWDCVTARINLRAVERGYSWRLKNIPAAFAIAVLVDEAVNGTLAGITQGSIQDTLNIIFTDEVHLTPVGEYYTDLIDLLAIHRPSQAKFFDAAIPAAVTGTQASSLKDVAWRAFIEYDSEREWTPTMAEARKYVSDIAMKQWVGIGGTNYASFFANPGGGNPFDNTNESTFGWYTAP